MSQIKLVVFDMDGTIIEPRSSWAMIHDYFGTDNTEMLQMYIDHKISDKEFVKADIKLWNSKSDVPVNEEYINSILDKAKPRKGAKELITSLNEANIKTIILSGGIQYLADKWAKEWNMDDALANDLIDDEAMVQALVSRKIYAIGLDVYKGEPKIHPEYLKQPTAFILPHLGSATKKTRTAMADLAIDNIDEYFKTGMAKIKLISTITN